MTIGDRIKSIRMQKKISQVELAERTKVLKQTLYKYENNIITNIPSDKIEAIASELGVSPAYLMGWQDAPNIIEISGSHKRKYPLYGVVACGEPNIASCRETFEFDDLDADFALRCIGDSMINAHIYDGDLVFLRKCGLEDIRNGEIAAVRTDHYGDCTLKKIYYDDERKRLTLMPCNPDYEPIIFDGDDLSDDEVQIIGKAVAVISML